MLETSDVFILRAMPIVSSQLSANSVPVDHKSRAVDGIGLVNLCYSHIWSSHIRIVCLYKTYYQSCYMDVKHGLSPRH